MAVSSLIKFVQGALVGTAGVAVANGVIGTNVVTSNAVDTNVVRWQFTVVDSPAGSATTIGIAQDGATPTYTFAADVRGSYHLQLVVFDAGGVSATSRLVFAVPELSGRINPAFDSTNVENNFATLGVPAGTRGWKILMDAWLKYVDGQPALVVATSGAVNDLASADSAGHTVQAIRFTGAAPVLSSVASPYEGRILYAYAAGGPLVLTSDDGATGTAANRIVTSTGQSFTIPQGAVGILVYSNGRWRIVTPNKQSSVPPGWFNLADYGVLPTNSGSVNAANLQSLIDNPPGVSTPGTAITIYHPGGNVPLDPLGATGSARKEIVVSRTINLIGVAGGANNYASPPGGGSYATSQFTFALGNNGFWFPHTFQQFAAGRQCDGSLVQDVQITGTSIYSTLTSWSSLAGVTLGQRMKARFFAAPFSSMAYRRENRRYFECIQAGNSSGSEPTYENAYQYDHSVLWSQLPANVYNGAVGDQGHVWRDASGMSAGTPVMYVCHTSGTLGASPPTMNTTVGATTAENAPGTAVWKAVSAAGFWLVDGTAVWRCVFHSGILFQAPFCQLVRCQVNGTYANAGVTVCGDLEGTLQSDASEFHFNSSSVVGCGGGFWMVGTDANAGSLSQCVARTIGYEYFNGGDTGNKAGGFAFWDGSQLGNNFFGCSDETIYGAPYVIGYQDWDVPYVEAAATSIHGGYSEGGATLGQSFGSTGNVFGGDWGTIWSGVIRLFGTVPHFTRGTYWADQGTAKASFCVSDQQGEDSFMSLGSIDDPNNGNWHSWQYQSVFLNRTGWWSHIYGARCPMKAYSGSQATEGPGWSWCNVGEFKGGIVGTSFAGQYFAGYDASAMRLNRVRKSGHFTVGDRADLVGSGVAGTWTGYVVSTAGYRGATYTTGVAVTQGSGAGTAEPTIFEPTTNDATAVNGFPLAGGQVWKCTTSGVTGSVEPTWPVSPTPGVTTVDESGLGHGGTCIWTFLGSVPIYQRLGFVDGITVGTTPQNETSWTDSSATDSANKAPKTTARSRRTSVATTTNATGQVLETYALPDNSTTQIDVVVTGKRAGAHASVYKLSGAYYRDAGGNAVLVGSITKTSNLVGNSASQDCNLVISTTSVQVQVNPDETQNWSWSVVRQGIEGNQ